jgi:hypothetical protein
MYTEKDVFYVIDRNNDIVVTIQGYTHLVRVTMEYIASGIIGNSFKKNDWFNKPFAPCDVERVILDKYYNVVPVHQIRADYVEKKEQVTYYHRKCECCWEFRKDPVPGMGVKKYGFWYSKANQKKQQFKQERTFSFGNEKYLRAKRGRSGFDSKRWRWEEDVRGDIFIKRSWKKKKKKKQWM